MLWTFLKCWSEEHSLFPCKLKLQYEHCFHKQPNMFYLINLHWHKSGNQLNRLWREESVINIPFQAEVSLMSL